MDSYNNNENYENYESNEDYDSFDNDLNDKALFIIINKLKVKNLYAPHNIPKSTSEMRKYVVLNKNNSDNDNSYDNNYEN